MVAVADERIAGTASWLERRSDGERFLLWLHGHERPEALAALVAAAIRGTSSVVSAFTLTTPLQPIPTGLPIRHRPVTHVELVAAGFVGRERCCCSRAEPPSAAQRDADVRTLLPDRQWLLSVTAADERVAEMWVQLDPDGIGEGAVDRGGTW